MTAALPLPPDNGLNTPRASRYNAAHKRMDAMMQGIEPEVCNPAPVMTAPPVSTKAQAVEAPTTEATEASRRAEALRTLGLTSAETFVEFSYAPGEHEPFIVKIRPLALTVTDDNITLLVPPDFTIKPPKLVQFHLKVEDTTYTVVSVGTILQLDNMQVLSFVRAN